MKIAVVYVGSSLPAALRRAEREIEREYRLGLKVALHNCTLPLSESEFLKLEHDLAEAAVTFIIHVTDSDNSIRICAALDRLAEKKRPVIAINCLRDLMVRTRLKNVEFAGLFKAEANGARVARRLGSWVWRYASARRGARGARQPEEYLKYLAQAPAILRFLPNAGKLGDVKHYVALYCYFLQPTPANVKGLLLYAAKHLIDGAHGKRIKIKPPESRPAMGIYHPDAERLLESFDAYQLWYERRPEGRKLDPSEAVGLLLMRPQVMSGAHKHYGELVRALEGEGLPVIPVLSTFMDNRHACQMFLVDPASQTPRAAQILSLTGFSFVGGPAMNDSEAAVAYLKGLNRPLRSAISLEAQRTEQWAGSMLGLNAVQTAMQVAIPEIDGAAEPIVYAGTPEGGAEPEAFADRCARIARRTARWSRLRKLPRSEVKLALVVYCFPPNRGNLGTAADLDVFASLWEIFRRLEAEGYRVETPASADELRGTLLGSGANPLANVAYRLAAGEYYSLCPYVEEIEAEWGPAPGRIDTQGRDILIHGAQFGNVFAGVQPTFGYEGDPMKMLMARGCTPHHGFMGFYAFLSRVYQADALIHVGTHGALEFMPGKQVGLSSSCWPDRLIGDLPNLYLYSINNPSEGSIAKRRSYAELISYLTPPIENAGLYKDLAALKELIGAYRQEPDERRREQIFGAIAEKSRELNMVSG
jgi:magnesium chelatase subunit H